MSHIFQLPPLVVDTISTLLSQRDRWTFARTCKAVFQLCHENAKFEALAEFVIKNYLISERMRKDLPFWLRLKVCPTILIGETHIIDAHRRAFGAFVNTIWDKRFCVLYLEGGTYSPRTGPLAYVRDAIAAKAKTWDLDKPRLEKMAESIGTECSYKVLLIGKFLCVKDADTPEVLLSSIEELIDIFKRACQRLDCPQKICIPQIEKLRQSIEGAEKAAAEKNSDALIYELFSMRYWQASICSLLGELIFKTCTSWAIEGEKERESINQERDSSLETHLFTARQQKKRAIAYGGSGHMNIAKDSPFLKGAPFISLIPLHELQESDLTISSLPEQKPGRERIKEFTLDKIRSSGMGDLYRYSRLASQVFRQERNEVSKQLEKYTNYLELSDGEPFEPRDLIFVGNEEMAIIMNLANDYLQRANQP